MRVLISFDEVGATILDLPNDITISSACGKWELYHGFKRIVARVGYLFLDWMKTGHCESAIIHDESRDKVSKDFLEKK